MTLHHVLLVDCRNATFLVTGDFYLPKVDFEGSHCADVEGLCATVEALIEKVHRVVFLRPEAEIVYPEWNDSLLPSLLIFEVLPSSAVQKIPSFQWSSYENAHNVIVSPKNAKILEYLHEFRQKGLEVHSSRLWPYSRAGWYGQACQWMTCEITRTANKRLTEIAKISVHDGGCVLRGRSREGDRFYMKGVNPDKHAEVKVAQALSEFIPDAFPRPLASDEQRGFLLMNDYGNTMCAEECSVNTNQKRFQHVLLEWARIQKASLPFVSELKKAGVPTRDADYFRDKVQQITSDNFWFQSQLRVIRQENRREYSHGEYKRKYIEHASGVLAKIEELQWPLSVIHGDLNPVNVTMSKSGTFTFFDYEYTAVGYGFVDALDFGFSCNRTETLHDIKLYFNEWTDFVGPSVSENHFQCMKEFNRLMAVCNTYDRWNRSEQCGILFNTKEMSNTFLVCRHFENE